MVTIWRIHSFFLLTVKHKKKAHLVVTIWRIHSSFLLTVKHKKKAHLVVHLMTTLWRIQISALTAVHKSWKRPLSHWQSAGLSFRFKYLHNHCPRCRQFKLPHLMTTLWRIQISALTAVHKSWKRPLFHWQSAGLSFRFKYLHNHCPRCRQFKLRHASWHHRHNNRYLHWKDGTNNRRRMNTSRLRPNSKVLSRKWLRLDVQGEKRSRPLNRPSSRKTGHLNTRGYRWTTKTRSSKARRGPTTSRTRRSTTSRKRQSF